MRPEPFGSGQDSGSFERPVTNLHGKLTISQLSALHRLRYPNDLFNSNECSLPRRCPPFGRRVRSVSAEHLQARISKKNEKVGRYVSASSETWLLIVFDSRRCSGTFDLDSRAFEGVYESAFSRTFVFDTFSATVRELVTCKPRPIV